ncbi:CerR family C-terminal domain-containing protein [Pseudodesulfovibrio sp.]|uniref:TetR/AcrR family transcriptional regulator n=1 Tax=Pseudodesulfovibrio sp. TaxID=2035812 RepID=UPI00260AB1EB|nr:CerR family C-terminal domain-containing protein [Pseudodesulfovibrio sp.]MDD3312936.1 CerR family C-terminal domain-containing protein [Pseudodesulfovibrio sp.]
MNRKPDVNTKEALLTAAIRVFADKGFDAATVRDICSLAEANVAAVNYHYGGKEALYAAVLEEVFPKEEREPGSDASLPPEERLRIFLRDLAGEIYERGNEIIAQRWAIFLREMAKPSRNLDFLIRRQIQPLTDDLRAIVAEILGPDAPDSALAMSSTNIWALMLDHLLTQPIQDRLTPSRPAPTDMDALVDHVTTFALGGLLAVKAKVAPRP